MSKSFEEVLAVVDAAVGHLGLNEFCRKIGSTTTHAAIEKTIRGVVGPSGLMEFIRFDHGEIL
jgi:cobalamin biosynthesis protein CbiG